MRFARWSSGSSIRTVHSFKIAIQQAARYDRNLFAKLVDGTVWEIANGVPIERVGVGVRRLSLGRFDVAVGFTPLGVSTHYLRSGEEIVRDVPRPDGALLLPDGRTVLARTSDAVLVFREGVPTGYAEARSWLEGATNARLDTKTGALRWVVN